MRTGAMMLGAILEALPEPVVVTNARGLVLLANRRALATFGYEWEGLFGRPLACLLPGVGRDGRVVGRRVDGTEFPVRVRARAARSGAVSFEIVCIQDATQRPARGSESRQLERLAALGLRAVAVARDGSIALGALAAELDHVRREADQAGVAARIRDDLAVLQGTARRLQAMFERLLEDSVPAPGVPLGEPPPRTSAERDRGRDGRALWAS